MDEEKLKEILKKAEEYMVGMNDFERETYLRALLMKEFSTGLVGTDMGEQVG